MLPLITVVIPIYNVEKYLFKCVNSVINQTYNNLEIILVNDGSTDDCAKICEELLLLDDRILIINKENGGLSDARNTGIAKAKGEYISLIDSDDYVSKDYIEYLYNLLKSSDADISICNPKYVYENENNCLVSINKSIIKEMNSIEALSTMLYQNYYDTSAWGKLYKTSLFTNIFYPIGKLFEDLGTTYKLLLKANKIVFGNEEKYYYLQRENSISNNEFNCKKLDYLYFAEEIYDYIIKEIPEIRNSASSRVISVCCNILLQLPNDNEYKNLKKEMYRKIIEKRRKLIWDKNVRKKNKIIIYISYLPFNIFIKVFNIISKYNRRIILKE